jgi:hypothetical protein
MLMSVENLLLPDYLVLSPEEKGNSLNISFSDYRMLARTGLSLTQLLPATMGVYCLPSGCGAALDIWFSNRCLTIRIDSREAGQLALLLFADLDSVEQPNLLFLGDNSQESWKELDELARMEICKP